MKICAIPGSLRKDSYNRKLLHCALEFLKDHDVDIIDLKASMLPIYDADIQAVGFPEAVMSVITRIRASEALVIATPEYNFGTPGGLKNMIDWVSRSPEKPFHNKTAFLMSASTGGFGGLRAQMTLRQTFQFFNVIVLPQNVMVSHAAAAFDENGKLKDEKVILQIKNGCEELIRVANALRKP
jgi:chromate reductase